MSSKLIITIISILTASLNSNAKLEAHEWGTFTSLVGSNGITQDGMYHEDEALPDFVHGFGELRTEKPVDTPPVNPPNNPRPPCHSKVCFDDDSMSRNIITQKMETPVIYFYSDRYQKVDVNVKFPEGVVTETYPGPVKTFPSARDNVAIANGDTTFSVEVLNTKVGDIPFVQPTSIYSHARRVDSNLVRSGIEQEKFIFYRGIGRFQPQFEISSLNGGINLKKLSTELPTESYLVHVDDFGNGQIMKLRDIKAGTDSYGIDGKVIADLKNHQGENGSSRYARGEEARGMLVDSLVRSGLKKDEAYAMIDTWESGYLRVPGLRLLYILPRNEVDTVLPIQFTPAPEKLVRSFVGRIEILLDTAEQAILTDILREQNKYRVEKLGRFAEPILRRIAEVYAVRPDATTEINDLMKELINRAKVENTKTAVLH